MADTAYGRASGNPLLALASDEPSGEDLETQDA
jgi:hypothetical protein